MSITITTTVNMGKDTNWAPTYGLHSRTGTNISWWAVVDGVGGDAYENIVDVSDKRTQRKDNVGHALFSSSLKGYAW
jgi:hypothetical protein